MSVEGPDLDDAQAQEDRLAVLNLHDAFMNAHLLLALMESTPPPEVRPDRTLEDWTTSRRGRLERLWVAMLHVLLEAWQRNEAVRRVVAARSDTRKLEQLIEQSDKDALRETRHYMCHRDKREYWNEGRTACLDRYPTYRALTLEFGEVLLGAIRAGRSATKTAWPRCPRPSRASGFTRRA
jgi:hypothetical protein